MDSKEVKKRLVDDVVAPATKTAPTLDLKKRQTIVISDASEPQVDSLLPPAEFTTKKEPEITAAPVEKVVAPPVPEEPIAVDSKDETSVVAETEQIAVEKEVTEPAAEKEVAEAPAVDPLPEQAPPVAEEPKPEPPEDKEVPVSEVYEARDALPDNSERAASEIKEGMQDPKMYDTTAYHVPIKETHHGHGSAKAALAFGVLCAVVAVGAAIYFMVIVGS